MVEVYSREDAAARWTVAKYFRLETEVYFPSVEVRVLLGEIYRNITWKGRQAKFAPGAGIPAQYLPLVGM